VTLRYSGALIVNVCDSGKPIPASDLPKLMRAVMVSQQGLGLGLYQAAKWAEQLGYSLTLESNQDGKVCFELRGK
jgi:signal transduction histidine kinase